MSWEFYIVPSLFWFGLAVLGVGFVVAVGMVIRAVRDLIKLECKDD